MNVKIEGDTLVITIDVSKEAFKTAPPSQSGKSRVVASTHGFSNYVTPNGSLGLSVNATTK
jgi:hypothetical protein